MLIAIEEHWADDAIDRAVRALEGARADPSPVLNDREGASARLADLGDGRLEAMDQQGIDVQVMSLAPPGTQGLGTADAIALSRDANDIAAARVAERPDRFAAMATLPLADPAAAAQELERAAKSGFVGAMVYGRTGDVPLDDPRFDDLWGVAAAHRLPIFIHPQIPPIAVRNASYSGLGELPDLALSTIAWGWHLEAGTAALRLMTSGVLDRHPELQLVLGHWGELLLFWHERADTLAHIANLDRSITDYLRQNVWITASGMFDPALLHHALAVTTPDRILFSTDYPFLQPTAGEIAAFVDALPDQSMRDSFTFGAAQRLFHLEPRADVAD